MKRAFAEHLVRTGRVPRQRFDRISPIEWSDREPLGRLAMLHGLLNAEDIDMILRQQGADDRLFAETAVRLGILTDDQLAVLFRGQAIRACIELVEDLALTGAVDLNDGLEAVREFCLEPDVPVGGAAEVAGAA